MNALSLLKQDHDKAKEVIEQRIPEVRLWISGELEMRGRMVLPTCSAPAVLGANQSPMTRRCALRSGTLLCPPHFRQSASDTSTADNWTEAAKRNRSRSWSI